MCTNLQINLWFFGALNTTFTKFKALKCPHGAQTIVIYEYSVNPNRSHRIMYIVVCFTKNGSYDSIENNTLLPEYYVWIVRVLDGFFPGLVDICTSTFQRHGRVQKLVSRNFRCFSNHEFNKHNEHFDERTSKNVRVVETWKCIDHGRFKKRYKSGQYKHNTLVIEYC